MKDTAINAGFEVDKIKIFDCVCTSETLAPAGGENQLHINQKTSLLHNRYFV